MVEIRSLVLGDAQKIEDIDRSEHLTIGYRFHEGLLEAQEVDWYVPRWTKGG